ncbi:MAG: amidohydrolase family protein [Chloroflexi bacterium]|nr:amidohydrolase family protein [Chloroflexota bacterium]
MAFHAENEALVSYHTNRLLQEGKTGVEYFSQSRPNVSEAEPVRSMIYLSQWAPPSAALYFFHLSSREALAQVRKARARGMPVYGETCPHYLAFNDEAYRGERAIQFIRFPPIRSAADQQALWQGVIDGSLDCIGTDHVTALLSVKREKSRGKPFTEMPGGMAHVENRLAYMYSEGCASGRIPLNRLVGLVAANPAKIFGLYPRKGAIAPGSDADIVLIDPRLKKTVTNADLHMGVDYTIYEGMTFTGAPVMTIARGKVIVEKGSFLGSLKDGEFLTGR